MRIIGGHDYYDSGMAWGRDDTLLFLRNGDRRMSQDEMRARLHLPRAACSATLTTNDPVQRERIMRFRRPTEHTFNNVFHDRIEHTTEVATVILCGTLRHGLHLKARQPFGISKDVDERWIWSADALRAYAADHGLGVDEGRTGTAKTWTDGAGAGVRQEVDVAVQTLDEWFEPVKLTGAAREALVTERVTIASRNPLLRHPMDADGKIRPWRIDQDSLGEMGFAKALGPYEAFQELSMWFGGVLPRNGPPMVEITDDKVKIAKHGFHHPTSFRREKEGAQ